MDTNARTKDMSESIALLRPGKGLDLDSYVERVFANTETAHRYANRQSRHVRIVRIPGTVKVGDKISATTRLRSL